MKYKFAFISLIFIATSSIIGCKDDNINQAYEPKELTVQAVGTATGTPATALLPGVNIEVTGNAFTMDLFDKQTGELLGSVTDINVEAETFEDGSMKGENYTIFTFKEDESKIVLHNFIDMTPIDSTTLNGIIQSENTKDNVIGGTGRFADVSGGSTLNAILDMTNFAEGTVGFDCTYHITLN